MLEDELELGFSASPAGSPVRMEHRTMEQEQRRQEVRLESVEIAETKKKRTISQYMRRRRSLSPTYIELMRPVSELIRPTRAMVTVEVEGVITERRSPTPERTRPRSPSPIKSVERSSRSSSRFERSARFDIMSRYEAKKAALKSERKYQVVSQTPFSLDHAPRVTVRMRSHRIPTGKDTKFTLNIQAKPEAEITWFHNGNQIDVNSDRHIFTNMTGVLSITILECQEEDSGTYRCVCSNSKGETSDYATLEVFGAGYATYSSRRRDEEVPRGHVPEMCRIDHYHASHFKAGYSSESHFVVAESKSKMTETRETMTRERYAASSAERYSSAESAVTEEVIVHKEKHPVISSPKIEALPEDISIETGKVLTVSCAFSGEAKRIEWSRGGRTIEVTAGGRFHIETSEDLTTLIITGVKEEDAGTYTLKLSNEFGSDAATVHISVRSA
uniref:Ig-like domain-containing protein n=1 Tax=Gouania willdenowi TaxID=441366 RepID=A0A8C5DXA3_GOUWI